MGGEFWYSLDTYMPESWSQTDKSDTIITQWHAQPDSGNPVVALQTKYVNGEQHYNLIIRSHPSQDGTSGYKYITQYDLGKIDGDIGDWTNWTYHIKWSASGDGFLELYKDGKQVVDFEGGTCYVDDAGPYMKIGLYKYDWKSSTDTGADSRTIYVDNVRVGDSSASLASMM
ncbi:polysaccharide lyase, partial [Azospirillum sp. ST 5-10]|uniref:polysaccharide lyase n=1 Tax=unclassified Azospirillum TaxID=2630922 RepID=UPI003F49E0F6